MSDRPDRELGPPWREGLDDADTVGVDLSKLSKTDYRTFAAVDDLRSDADVEENRFGPGEGSYSREGAMWLERSPFVDLHLTLVRFSPADLGCPGDEVHVFSDDRERWKTKLVLVGVV